MSSPIAHSTSAVRKLLLVAIASTLITSFPRDAVAQASAPSVLARNYGSLPLAFEENRGQAGSGIRFVARGEGYSLAIEGPDAMLWLRDSSACSVANLKSSRSVSLCTAASTRLRMSLVDEREKSSESTRQQTRVTGEELLPGRVNYLIGNDPAKWYTELPTYRKVRLTQVYPGVDLLYYGNQRRLEYDFVVAAGADPDLIRMQFGTAHLRLNSAGDLEIALKDGKVVFKRPVIYQERNGRRRTVSGGFQLLNGSTTGFRLGAYDRSRPLIIDPVLSYSTYINGASVAAVAVDTAGETYITGAATAISPTPGAYQQADNNHTGWGGNAYVMKLNASGTDVIYATYLGGSGGDQILPPLIGAGDGGLAIAVDASGDAYLTGFTYSFDFPLMNPVQSTNPAGEAGNDAAFITELNPTGSGLIYSTYMGGSGLGNGIGDMGTGIAVDATGATYVTGDVNSIDFPTTPGALQSSGPVFMTKLTPNGASLVYTTCFASGYAYSAGIAVDTSGAAYITGSAGGGIPVTPGAYQGTNHSAHGANAYVAKINPTGTALGYATYLGGSGRNYTNSYGQSTNMSDAGNAIAVDSSGNAYVTGSAGSQDFPITSGALQPNNVAPPGLTNVFVTKMNPAGTALVYSTYLGGTGTAAKPQVDSTSVGYGDQGNAIAIDAAGDTYVAGWTGSADFPVTTNAAQSTNAGLTNKSTNAFVFKLNPAGSVLLYSSYLGGSGSASSYSQGDSATAVAADSSGNIYIGGDPESSDFPTTAGAFETAGGSGFVSKMNPAAGSEYALSITPATLEVFASQVGSPSNAAPVTITNIGSADVTISGISIAGTDASEFTQTNTCGMLEPSDTCTVSVIFTPTTAGKQTATLSVANTATGSPQSVALVGNETVYPPDPVLSPTQLTFPPQAGGSSTTQTVTLTNQGKGVLSITSIAASSWWTETNTCGTTLAAGASCTISVIFTPPSADASTSAALVVVDNANSSPQQVTLSGSATVVNVVVSPLVLNFAAQAVGTTSPAQTVTVNNYSTVPITFSSVSATGDFAVTNNCNGPVPANGSCSALVTFKPTAPGIRTGTLTVTDSASNLSWQVPLNGGVPPITLMPMALTFAAQAVGTTSDVQIVKVAYTGQGASYAISSIVVSGDFVWNKDLNFSCEGATLGLYSSCNVEVAFKPTAAGTRTGTLTITDTASNSPQMAALTGTGVGPVTLSATALSFAQQTVGSTSAAQTVTLTNSGTAALKITSVAASGDFAETNTCGSSLVTGATCSIVVTFTPTATGTRPGTLTIADSATGSPQTVALTGTGTAPAVTLSATTLGFAQQAVGSTSAAQTVMLTNSGQAALTIASVGASGDFAQTNTCGTSLAAGANCNITVTFTPTATGTRTGIVTLTDNGPGSPQTIALTGVGIAPAVTLSATTLGFAQQAVGSTSAAQTVMLTNSGQAALTIASVGASGDFAQTNTCGTSLAADANCNISVTFTPIAAGTRIGTLTITDNANGTPQMVSLSGTGIVPAPVIAITPGSLIFEAQTVGSTSAAQMITLTNSGTAPLSFTSITASGDFAETNTCGTSLAVAANCTVSVTFTPTAAGSRTGAISVFDNAAGSPQTATLTGTGTTVGITASPQSMTISAPGGSATDTLTISSQDGFSGMVSLTCKVSFQGTGTATDPPACVINPAQGQIAAGGSLSVTLTVSTTASGMAEKSETQGALKIFAALLLLGFLPRRRWRRMFPLILVVVVLGGVVFGCGGHSTNGGGSNLPGTSAGSYAVVVTATSGTATGTTTISLSVN